MGPRTRTSLVEPSEVDFESDLNVVPDRKPTTINRTVTKAPKRRGVTMKKARASPAVATAPKAKAAREALKDRTNVQEEAEQSEVVAVPAKKRGRKPAAQVSEEENTEPAAKRAKATNGAQARVAKTNGTTKAATAKKRVASPGPASIIPETQQVEDVSESIEVEPESMLVEEPEIKPKVQKAFTRPRSVSNQQQAQTHVIPPRARSTSQQPRVFSREGSAALTDRRLAEGESRRKLADMTSKYEDMRLKYESLSELGTNAAESNFDKLKRATDQRAKDASDLIASLKKELSEARRSSSTTTSDNAKLHTQINTLQTNQEQAQNELKGVQTSLSEAQNEVKALTAKLEAAREAARKATVEAAKAPGSAIKNRDLPARTNITGSNLDSAKQAALKEELYRDLTGLIINSVKRKDGEDEFSCIQTGRNGTLHFHLSVNNDSTQVNPKTPSGLSYEDAEFAYEPFFDEGRDRDLIDILPDYLTEEICFPRSHAVKFYTKVVDSMTKKVVIEE
ncbi:hypothetical protein K461DRAFT_294746 [Myriangium duriaei CBS 260.36]|uniref:Monopolin complex subunit Csm1/Pcs1 C-terminal domain-containing protein n=1 Tax=Myriangium duriaei CBS 260.36 TaxID=1168546 RepID=A0A9P4MJA0_9PEZI|nr:hypothetical protein K461DRAFT_294746 [Myriangium duriaei CBS 260.36]